MPSPVESLSLRGVSVRYGGTREEQALHEVSLQLAAGEFIAILGPSGAGKSTLIRCLNLLVRPTSGSVLRNGRDLTLLSPAELRKARTETGMVFQQFHLVRYSSALTNVLSGSLGSRPAWKNGLGWFSAEERRRAVEALERVGLADFAQRRVDQLSGGQQQRVAIARMMMQRPSVILGDEPVSSLDPITAKGIMDELAELHRQGTRLTVVNLHSPELARLYASRIIGLNRGRVVFDGPPDDLTGGEAARIYRTS